MPLLDRTMGGGTAFFVILSPFVTLAPRGRNKKYHTRKKTMAKPCRIMVGMFFFARAKAQQRLTTNDEEDDPSAVSCGDKTNDEKNEANAIRNNDPNFRCDVKFRTRRIRDRFGAGSVLVFCRGHRRRGTVCLRLAAHNVDRRPFLPQSSEEDQERTPPRTRAPSS
jgi:hypothetical protein